MLYTPLLPGRGGGHAGAAPRRRAAARGAAPHRPAPRAGHRRRPDAASRSHVDPLEGHERALHYDHLIVALGLGLADAADPGPGRARDRLQDAGRGDRAAQPRPAHAGDGRVARRPARARAVPDLRVRRRRLRRASRAWPSCRTSPPTSSTSTRAAASRACAGCSSRPPTGSCPRSPRPGRLRRCASCAGRGHRVPHSTRPSRRSAPTAVAPLQRRDAAHAHASCGRRASSPIRSSAQLGLPLDDGGRIVVDRYMQVDGPRRTCGRSATPPPCPTRPSKGQAPRPPTAQHALRQGKRVARNVAAASADGRTRPFTYKTLGVFVDLGRHQAVASTLGIRWRGFPAWFLARTYHLWRCRGSGASSAWSPTGPSPCCSRATPPSSASSGIRPALERGATSSRQSAGGSRAPGRTRPTPAS